MAQPEYVFGIELLRIIPILSSGADSEGRIWHGSVTGGPFQVGETITGGTSLATADVVHVGDGYLDLTNIAGGPFQAGETITGGTSSASATASTANVTVVLVSEPQEAAFTAVIAEGEAVDQRGGDLLRCRVEDEDRFLGQDVTFRNAKLSAEAVVAMCGGALQLSGSDVIGWQAPDSQATQPLFRLQLFGKNYTEGSHDVADHSGYIQVDLYWCKAQVPSFTLADRQFVSPELTIQSRENPNVGTSYAWQYVAALP